MNAAKYALLLSAPMFLTACGGASSDGGGGSTYTPPKYKIDFVALKEVPAGQENGCAIYGQDASQTMSFIAQKAQGTNIGLHIHNSDGSQKSSTQPSKGAIQVQKNKVPSDGYISLVATSRGGIYDILTIQKPFIPAQFTVNSFDNWDDRVSCFKESTVVASDYTGNIDDGGDGNGYFVFRSTIDEVEALSPNSISYSSLPNKEVLAARLCRDSSSCDEKSLMEYAFIPADATKERVTLTQINNPSTPWYTLDSNNTTLKSAKLSIYRSGTGAILWQNLPLNDGAYSYASALDDLYYLNVSAEHKTWSTEYTKNIKGADQEIDEFNTLNALNLPEPTTTLNLEENCPSSVTGYCVSGYSSATSGSIDLQRSTFYADAGNKIHQTIYAAPKINQPLMMFNDTNIDNVWDGAIVSKLETSLFETNQNSDVQATLTSGYFDASVLNNNNYQTTSGVDTISIVNSTQQNTNNKDKLQHQDYKAFSKYLMTP